MPCDTIQYNEIPYGAMQRNNMHFWAQNCKFSTIGAIQQPAGQTNGHLLETQRYLELPQDNWDIVGKSVFASWNWFFEAQFS